MDCPIYLWCQIILMQPSSLFPYNLPCIPGKGIRLRIESLPKSGFSSKATRISENYTKMNDSFVSQYSNLKPKRAQSVTNQSDTSTKASSIRREQPEHWYIIPQHKGILISLYQEQGRESSRQVNNMNAALRKRENISKKLYSRFIKEKNEQKSQYQQILKEEYHKMWEEEAKKKENRKVKNSPCFMSVPRARQVQQEIKHQEVKEEQMPHEMGQKVLLLQDFERSEGTSQAIQPIEEEQLILNMDDLKGKTQKMLEKMKYKPKQPTPVRIEETQQQQQAPSYMFAKDDRDRFGNQIFPVVARVNNPGPGSYAEKNTMESKAKRVKLLQQQRRILKQWFND